MSAWRCDKGGRWVLCTFSRCTCSRVQLVAQVSSSTQAQARGIACACWMCRWIDSVSGFVHPSCCQLCWHMFAGQWVSVCACRWHHDGCMPSCLHMETSLLLLYTMQQCMAETSCCGCLTRLPDLHKLPSAMMVSMWLRLLSSRAPLAHVYDVGAVTQRGADAIDTCDHVSLHASPFISTQASFRGLLDINA
jgi:hypothetical protein